jgi:ABC-type uncharacterized transport system substrate-binding protein
VTLPESTEIKRPARKPEVRVEADILLSSEIPAYSEVVDELIKRIGPHHARVYLLNDDPGGTAAKLNQIQQSGYRHVIAIGLPAALAARSLGEKSVVFCQVLSYQEPGLIGPHMRGVRMTPPLSSQLSAWKTICHPADRVGMITGRGLQDLVADAGRVAGELDIEFSHETVDSDKEFLYVFKRLAPEIDGLWLVPDSRILSHRVIRKVMAYSVTHKIQVLAFHPQLLPLGALLSATCLPADVADQVVKTIKSDHLPTSATRAFSPAEMHLQVNLPLAEEFGLCVPPPSADLVYTEWPQIESGTSP